MDAKPKRAWLYWCRATTGLFDVQTILCYF